MRIVFDDSKSGPAADPQQPQTPAAFISKARRWVPTLKYLSETESHVYALSIAASVLLSFFPFLIVMLSLARYVFHMPLAENAIKLAINDYFPGNMGVTIWLGLQKLTGKLQVMSIVLLLFTANGVFEPLEVALNRAWGVSENRPYLQNQLLSLFLILICGGLALGSVLLTAVNQEYVATQFGIQGAFPKWLSIVIFKLAAIPCTILTLFVTYWLLPNCKIPARRIFPVSMMMGIILEVYKYIFVLAWPWLNAKFEKEYGPFRYSVSILIFTFIGSMLVLAGAEWTARTSEPRIAPIQFE